MKEMKRDETRRGYIFILGITALALLMLVSIAGAAPYAYVTNNGDGTVSVIDTATNTITTTIPVGWGPWGVSVDPAGTKIYVANFYDRTVSVIDAATNTVTATVPIGNNPVGIAVTPDGKKVYVANEGSNNVSVINTATNTVTATVNVGNHPGWVAISPDGTKVYVTNNPENTVSVIDTATNTVTATVNVGYDPCGIVVSPDGTKVYVANTGSNSVSVVNTTTNTVTSMPVGSYPYGVGITPDGTKVYVTNGGSNSVSVIDAATDSVTATVPVGSWPYAVGQFTGIVPVPEPILPVASFSSNITSGSAPLTIQFTDLSENATGWNWDFEDGDISTDENPVHTFSEAGEYTVNLTVSNENGTDSKVDTITVSKNDVGSTISVDVPANPIWTDTGLKVVKGQTVSIRSSGTWNTGLGDSGPDGDDNSAYFWELFLTSTAPSKFGELIAFVGPQGTDPYQGHWGDGSFFPQPTGAGYWAIGSSATFTADRDGELWLGINDDAVSKYIYDNSGLLSTTVTVTTPTVVTKPVASFSASPTYGNAPLTVTFTDKSTNSPDSWEWSFGDGTSSTEQNPVHTYSNSGKYTVKLTVNNAAGSSTALKSSYIIASNSVKPPIASFSASPTYGNSPLTVSFTDKSTNSPDSWEWNFGDGTSSTEQNPVHTYSNSGKYTVKLTVKNAAGSNTALKSSYIIVKNLVNPPTASFSAYPTSGNPPLTVTFADKSTNSPDSWEWSFGDGTYSTEQNPVHTYSNSGQYTVKLTVKNAAGSNTKIMSKYIIAQK